MITVPILADELINFECGRMMQLLKEKMKREEANNDEIDENEEIEENDKMDENDDIDVNDEIDVIDDCDFDKMNWFVNEEYKLKLNSVVLQMVMCGYVWEVGDNLNADISIVCELGFMLVTQ